MGKNKASREQQSRKPADTAFKQQRLKAWQPLLTPKTVLPTFFILGVILAPLGGLLIYESDTKFEISVDYTDCLNSGNLPALQFVDSPRSTFGFPSEVQNGYLSPQMAGNSTHCAVRFQMPYDAEPPIFMYYGLTNFYQNHRSYVKSLDYDQLLGQAVPADDLMTDDKCSPKDLTIDRVTEKPIYPCGMIANSMFNDTISSPVPVLSNGELGNPYVMTSTGISRPSDQNKYGKSQYRPSDVVPPPSWKSKYPNGYTETSMFDPTKDELFQVWMRTAGLPSFRKLYARNANSKEIFDAATYQVNITYDFPTKVFEGRKTLIITTAGALGGRNPFLGYSYIAVGIACVVFGIVFTARHVLKPRKLGDHSFLSWPTS